MDSVAPLCWIDNFMQKKYVCANYRLEVESRVWEDSGETGGKHIKGNILINGGTCL